MTRTRKAEAGQQPPAGGDAAPVDIQASLDEISEKLSLLLSETGFYTPAQVRQLTTLSDTEIARRQKDGRFPKYVELGPAKRAMPRLALQRWIYLLARGKEWSEDGPVREDEAEPQEEG